MTHYTVNAEQYEFSRLPTRCTWRTSAVLQSAYRWNCYGACAHLDCTVLQGMCTLESKWTPGTTEALAHRQGALILAFYSGVWSWAVQMLGALWDCTFYHVPSILIAWSTLKMCCNLLKMRYNPLKMHQHPSLCTKIHPTCAKMQNLQKCSQNAVKPTRNALQSKGYPLEMHYNPKAISLATDKYCWAVQPYCVKTHSKCMKILKKKPQNSLNMR